MANVFPGGANTYVPMAIAALQTNYSQNPSLFSINQYVTVANVPNQTGYYIYHDPSEETRIDYSNAADFLWPDGAIPQVNMGKAAGFTLFTCTRYRQMFTIGDLAAQQGTWNVLVDHSNTAAMRLMTLRTYNVLQALVTTGNWGANTASATSLGGGKWDVATSLLPYIQKGIQAAIVAIQKSTNATVRPQDLMMIVSPATAYMISQSQEVIDYLKQSYVAKESMQQDVNSGFNYGIPDPLYGVRVIVEDRVYNSGPHGGTAVNNFILGDVAVIVARPGSLMGPLNTMSTVTLAMYQDMQMILEHKNTWQLTEGVLFDNYATIVRPESGFLITDLSAA